MFKQYLTWQKPAVMLKENEIIKALEMVVHRHTTRYVCDISRYVWMSRTHRIISDVLLLRHFRGEPPIYVSALINYVLQSDESVRRAIKDGIAIGVIEVVMSGDARAKPLRATKKLVDAFRKRYVESNDPQLGKETTNENPTKGEEVPSGHLPK